MTNEKKKFYDCYRQILTTPPKNIKILIITGIKGLRITTLESTMDNCYLNLVDN